MIPNYDTKANFWELYPDFTEMEPFKTLRGKDRTRGKTDSSTLMWCIVMIWDSDSIWYNLPETGKDNKIDAVFEEKMDNSEYYYKHKALVDTLKEKYILIERTATERSLMAVERKLDERAVFLDSTPYMMPEPNERGQMVGGTADTLDKMLANTKKLTELVREAKKDIEKQSIGEGRVKGGGKLSLSDRGMI